AVDSLYVVREPGVFSAISYNGFECASMQSKLVEVILSTPDTKYSHLNCSEFSILNLVDIDIGVGDLIWFSDYVRHNSLQADAPLKDGVTYYATSISTNLNYSAEVFLDACLDIAIDKRVDALEAAMETQVNFTIVVSNQSNVKGENLIIKEQLPDGYTYEDH